MPPMQGQFFDATTVAPEQSVGKHPAGKKFPAIVKNTAIEETSNKEGAYFQVLFETPSGQIFSNYNLWNKNTQTVEIAQKQLSALCHATGVFKLNGPDEGAIMRGAQCMIDIDDDPKDPKYSRVTKVYDRNGNEPGKPPSNASQPQATPTAGWSGQPTGQAPNGPAPGPMTQQPGGGWNAPQPGQVGQAPAWTQQTPNQGQPSTPPWKT